VTAGVLTMPSERKRGRPVTGRPDQTGQVRVRADLAAMLRWVCDVRRMNSADIIDPLIRDAVTEEFSRLYPLIRQMHAESKTVAPLPVVLTADPQHPGQTITLEELHTRPPAAEKKRK
jgi:hypothetical protein